MNNRYKNRPFTKEEIKKVIHLWNDTTTREIAQAINRPDSSIFYIAGRIRKAGYNLPRKTITGRLNSLVKEVIAEI